MYKITAVFAACVFASTSMLTAQSPGPAKPAPTATAAATVAATLTVEDLTALRDHLNQVVDVSGTPTATGRSKTGTVVYLNFGRAHQALAVVAFLGSGAADPSAHKVSSEDDLKSFVGKPVIVHGKVADYKGDLQIALDSLDQIKLAP